MAFCSKTDFVGDVNLPSQFLNSDQFDYFLLKYEKVILVKLLGFDLYKAFITGVGEVTPLQKWTDLQNGKEYEDYDENNVLVYKEYSGIVECLKYFIYFFISDSIQSELTITGEVSAKNENSNLTSPISRAVGIWNSGIEEVFKCKDFIEVSNETDESTYPNFTFADRYFTNTNCFSI
jgi:hypothetical protein